MVACGTGWKRITRLSLHSPGKTTGVNYCACHRYLGLGEEVIENMQNMCPSYMVKACVWDTSGMCEHSRACLLVDINMSSLGCRLQMFNFTTKHPSAFQSARLIHISAGNENSPTWRGLSNVCSWSDGDRGGHRHIASRTFSVHKWAKLRQICVDLTRPKEKKLAKEVLSRL